jgi:hypothetical protein
MDMSLHRQSTSLWFCFVRTRYSILDTFQRCSDDCYYTMTTALSMSMTDADNRMRRAHFFSRTKEFRMSHSLDTTVLSLQRIDLVPYIIYTVKS